MAERSDLTWVECNSKPRLQHFEDITKHFPTRFLPEARKMTCGRNQIRTLLWSTMVGVEIKHFTVLV